ncbi:YbaB/EbfC family nucleoid-associated protein [Umezawaea sp. NPDC059074]|uniref:YbaB/EbfC family nucleoid-associated protein n=1 Tax=Umezawaea sp. NPDC059074 TaxID=3346716 RepID=UPI0036AFF2B5
MTDPHQYVDRFEQRLQQAKQQADAIGAAFRESRSVAQSPDGAVVVTVASGGRIDDIQLTPKAMDLGHTALSRTIMATLRTAQVEAARAMEEAVRPLLGDGASMEFLREQVEQSIVRTDPSAAPEPPTRGPDDFDGGFLR